MKSDKDLVIKNLKSFISGIVNILKEIKAVDNGKVFNSEVVDRNIFFAITAAFQKVTATMAK